MIARRLICTGAVALSALVLSTSPRPAQAAEPQVFKIGAVVSLSGPYGIFGEDMRKGVEIALQERGGKVLGKPIEVVWEDDETKPQAAVQKTTRLISDGAQMIFGAVSSASTLAMMNVTRQRQVPHLVTLSADDKITVPGGSRYTFRTSNTLGMEQRMALEFVKDKGLKRVYGVTADYQATRDSWSWFSKEAEKAGITIVGADFPPLGNRDYSTIVDKIARSDADGVALFMTGADVISLLKQAGQVNLSANKTILGPVIADETMAAAVGAAALGVQSGVRYHFSLDNPANAKFVAAYREKFNAYPPQAAGEAYDGISWWLDVVEQTGSWDKDAWITAFETSTRENSVEGTKAMRACDHQATQPGLWAVVTQGQPGQPTYVMNVEKTFAPAQIFEPCPQ